MSERIEAEKALEYYEDLVLQAIEWCHNTRHDKMMIKFATGLSDFLRKRGRLSDGLACALWGVESAVRLETPEALVELFPDVITMYLSQGKVQEAISWCGSLYATFAGRPLDYTGLAFLLGFLFMWGNLLIQTGECEEAKDHLGAAYALARNLQVRSVIEPAYQTLMGAIELRIGQTTRAAEYYRRALRLLDQKVRVVRDAELQAALHAARLPALVGLSETFLLRGDYVRAEQCGQEALEEAERCRDRERMTSALLQLYSILRARGKPAEAEVCLHRGLQLAEDAGYERLRGYFLTLLAMTKAERGCYEDAEHDLKQALQVARIGTDFGAASSATIGLARLAMEQGQLDDAEALLLYLLDEARQLQQRSIEALASLYLSSIHASQDRLEEAEQWCSRGLAMVEMTDSRLLLILALVHLSMVKLRCGQSDQAVSASQQAIAAASNVCERTLSFAALGTMVFGLISQKRYEEVIPFIKRILQMMQELSVIELLEEEHGEVYLQMLMLLTLCEDGYGHYEEAEVHCLSLLNMAQASRSPLLESVALWLMGQVMRHRDRLSESRQCYLRSLEISERSGITSGVAAALAGLSLTELCAGKQQEAQRYFRQWRAVIGEEAEVPGTVPTKTTLGEMTVQLAGDLSGEVASPAMSIQYVRPSLDELRRLYPVLIEEFRMLERQFADTPPGGSETDDPIT